MNRKIFYTLIVSIFFNCESDSLDEADNLLPDEDLIVSYSSEIASIMSVNCISCHSSPPVNGARFPLTTYTEVKEGIDLVLNRIQRKDADRPDDIGDYDENWKVKNDDTREENFSKRV